MGKRALTLQNVDIWYMGSVIHCMQHLIRHFQQIHVLSSNSSSKNNGHNCPDDTSCKLSSLEV